ncbi:hypothetical protein Mycsm_06581 (plasmid) [Mycobacterium sp. JS623]|nr:TIR domain-containing protein [Mycobacterium sp. JS623]AGB26717.1 hypothetical protein Mycsm_06581 [Mycobacterium sp. JS623]
MANVFISYSSADAEWANRIHQWVVTGGHEAFLDHDEKQSGSK